MDIESSVLLYDHVIQVDERVTMADYTAGLRPDTTFSNSTLDMKISATGERVRILRSLNEVKLRADLAKVYEQGIRNLSVVL